MTRLLDAQGLFAAPRPWRARAAVLAGVPGLLPVAGACGASSTRDGERFVEACTLISQSEAERWLAGPAITPEPSEARDDPETCRYRSDEAERQFLLQVRDGERFFSAAEGGGRPATAVVIDGLGDDAYIDDGFLSLLSGTWTVSVSRTQGPITDDELAEIAALVLNRLP